MIISPGRNFVFVHIPKTGGTSLATALEARAMADDILIGDTPKARRRRGRVKKLTAPGRLWKHARFSDIDGMKEVPPDPFVFTLVRNPWERMASLYRWSRMQTFSHPMIASAKALNFNAFLKANKPAFLNDNAECYVSDRAGQSKCTAFVRLEHLASDLQPVEDHLGFKLEIPHVNRSDAASVTVEYETETADLVGACFARDIERFGYDFPQALLAS